MVGEGLISEEDFWDARRRLLLEEQAKREARRNKGTPSNILAEIEVRIRRRNTQTHRCRYR
jgi:hypothetical protein